MNNYEYQKALLEKRIDAAYDAVIAAGHKNINQLNHGEKILQLTAISQELKSSYDKNHSSASLTENGVTFNTGRKLSFTFDSLKTFFTGVDAGLTGFDSLQDFFIRPSALQIRKGLEAGVSFDDIQKGFHIASSEEISEIPVGAKIIRKCDVMGVFENDDDAVRQARLDGTEFIKATDLSFTYDKNEDPRGYYMYVDCTESRKALSDFFLSDIQMNNIYTLNSILYEVEDWVTENFAKEQQVMTSELYPELKDRLFSKTELTDRLLETAFSHPNQNLEHTKEYLIRHCQQPGRALKAAAEHFYPDCELLDILDQLDDSQMQTVIHTAELKNNLLSASFLSFTGNPEQSIEPLFILADKLDLRQPALELAVKSGIPLSAGNREIIEKWQSKASGTIYHSPDDFVSMLLNIPSSRKVENHNSVEFFKSSVCALKNSGFDDVSSGQLAVAYCRRNLSEKNLDEIGSFIKQGISHVFSAGKHGREAFEAFINTFSSESFSACLSAGYTPDECRKMKEIRSYIETQISAGNWVGTVASCAREQGKKEKDGNIKRLYFALYDFRGQTPDEYQKYVEEEFVSYLGEKGLPERAAGELLHNAEYWASHIDEKPHIGLIEQATLLKLVSEHVTEINDEYIRKNAFSASESVLSNMREYSVRPLAFDTLIREARKLDVKFNSVRKRATSGPER